MRKENESKTDFEALAAMTDEDIDYSDIPALSDEFLATAEWIAEIPAKELIGIRLDKRVLDFYRKTGKGYQARINAVLRENVEQEEKKQVRKQA
jgi:uncharacterized protein (DUF4415 family)